MPKARTTSKPRAKPTTKRAGARKQPPVLRTYEKLGRMNGRDIYRAPDGKLCMEKELRSPCVELSPQEARQWDLEQMAIAAWEHASALVPVTDQRMQIQRLDYFPYIVARQVQLMNERIAACKAGVRWPAHTDAEQDAIDRVLLADRVQPGPESANDRAFWNSPQSDAACATEARDRG